MDNEKINQIALTMLPEIGAITAKKLIAYTGSASAVFSERASSLLKIPGIGPQIISRINLSEIMPEAEKEIAFIERHHIEAISFLEKAYPERLRNCEDGPVILYLKGINCLSSSRILSVVGTRNATAEGRDLCKTIVTSLALRFPELVIVSGLAYGIDITAHRSALEQGINTVAVMAHGLHTIYPSAHRETAIKITGQGALVTDFTTRNKPERNNFLRRNRIIAGLADATLVIESGEKGGALITAELASSYSREIMAVPGRVSDIYSKGCNMLIKKSIAALVEDGVDVAEILNWDCREVCPVTVPLLNTPLNDEEEKILRFIQSEHEASTEFTSIRTGIPIHKCISLMVSMELRGWLLILPGNLYRLRVKLP